MPAILLPILTSSMVKKINIITVLYCVSVLIILHCMCVFMDMNNPHNKELTHDPQKRPKIAIYGHCYAFDGSQVLLLCLVVFMLAHVCAGIHKV